MFPDQSPDDGDEHEPVSDHTEPLDPSDPGDSDTHDDGQPEVGEEVRSSTRFSVNDDEIRILSDLSHLDVKPPYEPTLGFYPVIPSELSPLVDEKHDAVVLGRGGGTHRKYGLKGTLDIGVVTEMQMRGTSQFGKKILFDAEFPHIVFICGKRGSGKSYTLGIIAEELARTGIGIGVVLVDPIGIFWSMKLANSNPAEVEILEKWGFKPEGMKDIRVLAPVGFYNDMEGTVDGAFSMSTCDLSVDDWCMVFNLDRFKAQGLLIQDAIREVKSGYSARMDNDVVEVPPALNYSIGDLIQCITYSQRINSKREGHAPSTRRSVIARLRSAASWGLFSTSGTSISEISKPNHITVIDVSHAKLGESKRALVVGILGRKILEGRIQTSRIEDARKVGIGISKKKIIPVTWLLIDEAHLLLPHSGETAATRPLIEYAKLGRKPGCGLVLATQRPAATNDDILSQVDMLIGHNLALEDDMTALRRRIPAKVPQQIISSDFIRGIPVGVGLLADQKTQRRAFMAQLRPRLTHHSGKASVPGLVLEDGSIRGMMETPQEEVIPYDPGIELRPTAPIRIEAVPADEVGNVPENEANGSLRPDSAVEEDSGVSGDRPVWGSTYLLKEKGTEKGYELFSKGVMSGGRGMVVSRTHPSKVSSGVGSSRDTRYLWLSKSSSDISVSPGNLQKLGMEINGFLKEGERGTVLLDGMEYLLSNNDFTSLLHLFESVNEKVVLNSGRFLVSMNPQCLDAKQLSMLEEEMDGVVDAMGGEEEEVSPGVGEDIIEPEVAQAELMRTMATATKRELVDVCRRYGLRVGGSKGELRDRILENYKEMERGEREMVAASERGIKEIDTPVEEGPELPAAVHREVGEEINWDEDTGSGGADGTYELEMKEKLRKLEEEAAEARREMEERLETERKAAEAEHREAAGQLEAERKAILKERRELEVAKKREAEAKIRAREKEAERKEHELERQKVLMEKEKLKREKELVRERERLEREAKRKLEREQKQLEKEMVARRREEDKRKAVEDKRKAAGKGRTGKASEAAELRPTGSPGAMQLRGGRGVTRRVVKPVEAPRTPGVEIQAIPPKFNGTAATATAQGNLKKELLFKVVERVLRVRLIYAPIYRIYCRKTTGILMFRKEKQSVIFVDGLSGDVILNYRRALKRTTGASQVYKLPPNQMLVIIHVGRGRSVEDIASDAHLAVPEVKRALTSLIKKGVVLKQFKESFSEKGKGVDVFSTTFDLRLPSDITTRADAIPPSAFFNIREDILGTVFSEKEVAAFATSVDPTLRILGLDLIYFPYYLADVVHNNGTRRVMLIDGIANRVDEEAGVGYMRLVLKEREEERRKRRK